MPLKSQKPQNNFQVEIPYISSWTWQLKHPIYFNVSKGYSIYTVAYSPLGMEVRDRDEIQAIQALKKLIIEHFTTLTQKPSLNVQERKDLAHLNSIIEKRNFYFDNNNLVMLIVSVAIIIISLTTAIHTSNSSRRLYTQASHKVEEMSSLIDYYKVENYLYVKYPYLKRRSADIHDMITYVYLSSQLYGIDPFLLLAQGIWESRGFEKDNDKTIGGAGEIGWWQILPSTGECFNYTRDDLKNTKKNVNFGAFYYKCCLDDSNGNEGEALSRYNGGRAYKLPQCQEYARVILNIRKEIIQYVQSH